ncbi:MAG: superinfection immunity protein [Betaproteobacteria bacterium]
MGSFSPIHWLIVLIFLPIYFLPSIIAKMRGKKNFIAILVLNIFLGGTGVGWVIALVWALIIDKEVV